MILENRSAAMITINTTPFISKKDALSKVKDGETLEYSRVNIPPTESRDIPDEFCDCDFVNNLIETGELFVRSSSSATKEATKEAPKPTEAMTAKQKKEFDELVGDAEIEGIDVSGCTTLKEIKVVMKKAGK